MTIRKLQPPTLRLDKLSLRGKIRLVYSTFSVLTVLVSVIVLANLIRISSLFAEFNDRDSVLSRLADDIRYYDVTLTDAVRAYLIDPQDKAAYARYYQDAQALDDTLKAAQRLSATETDRKLFLEIDRVNVALVEIEESLLAEPDMARAVQLYRTVYGELKAEYSSYVQTFFAEQRERLAASQETVRAALVGSIILFTTLTLGLLTVGGILTTLLGRNTVARLLPLRQVVVSFAQAQYDSRAPVTGHDELTDLAVTMNNMLDAIQKRDTERTRLIRDLQAAQRLAEENSRLKSEFLATMSHELRTPMNAIEGFTGILLNRMGGTEYNPKTEGYLNRIRLNSKRLLQLINDFLDLSRIESGRLELANQPFSPAILARRWQEEISALAEKKGLHFHVELDSDLPSTIYGDEEAVSKIAINLLGNAIKFTEHGQVRLAVGRQNGTWEIVVEDTGIGIPPHARDFIFEEFRQVDQTSRRKYGGTGLGLAIVQKYARAMGGSVNLRSELGKGSVFTVSLPCKVNA